MLNCWSENSQGQMMTPCRYELVQSSQSLSSLQCSLHNQTGHSLLVLCSGDSGQHGQVYHLEVRDKISGELVQNITNDKPRFIVSDLPPSNWVSGECDSLVLFVFQTLDSAAGVWRVLRWFNTIVHCRTILT